MWSQPKSQFIYYRKEFQTYIHGRWDPFLHFRVIRAGMAATLMPKSRDKGFPREIPQLSLGVSQLQLETMALDWQCCLWWRDSLRVALFPRRYLVMFGHILVVMTGGGGRWHPRGGRGCCWASCKTPSPKSHLAVRWRTLAHHKSRLSWLWKLINQGCVNSLVHLILTNAILSMYTFSFSNSFPLFCNICSWCEGRESTYFSE